jgi:Mn2+/Fe2+ NRAMP family transporter
MKRKLKKHWREFLIFLSIMGPGIITANVDNDAGGITTYSVAGAHFGYSLIWSFIPIIIALVIIQEMCSRMAVVTGKGLADLIREEFGVKVTFYAMTILVFSNLFNTISEFAGIAASAELFGIYPCAFMRRSCLVADSQRHLQVCRKNLFIRLPFLYFLYYFGLYI